MRIPFFTINSFTGEGFRGNPAGVCLPESQLSEKEMQYIASENNLSETAFVVRAGKDYNIRWFTPSVEVDLCGHATLASAYVLFEHIGVNTQILNFHSKSGLLSIRKGEGSYIMDFPADQLIPSEIGSYIKAFSLIPEEVFKGKTDYLLVFRTEDEIRNINPDMQELLSMSGRGIIVTAPGDKVDFVSRFFAPQSGIPEDPVTGSAHTSLVPYWSKILQKNRLVAWQLSERGGLIHCNLNGDRVEIEGQVTLYQSGHIYL